MQVFLTYTRDKLGCIPRQLPHTGGDAVHDMKLNGSTTQDNQEEPNVSFSVLTPMVLG